MPKAKKIVDKILSLLTKATDGDVGFLLSTDNINADRTGTAKMLLSPIPHVNTYEVSVRPFYMQGTIMQIIALLAEFKNISLYTKPDYGNVIIWINRASKLPKADKNPVFDAAIRNTTHLLGSSAINGLSETITEILENTGLKGAILTAINSLMEALLDQAKIQKVSSSSELASIAQNTAALIMQEGKIQNSLIDKFFAEKCVIYIGSGFPRIEKGLATGIQYDTGVHKVKISDVMLYLLYYQKSIPMPFGLFYDIPYIDENE